MPRNINIALTRETQKSTVYPFQAVKISLSTNSADDIRVWDGAGDISFDTGGRNIETFTGVGLFGTIAPIVENNEVSANGIQLELNGIPKSSMAQTLALDYQGRPCEIWVGAFTDIETKTIAGGVPYRIWKGRNDVLTTTETAESIDVVMTAESAMIDAQRPKLRTISPESQRVDHPTDEIFDFIASLQNTTIRVR